MTSTRPILVVDDEADIRDGVCRWLGAAGYQSLVACDGAAGFEAAVRHRPQAILLDMLMPQQNGIETLAALRGHAETVDIPVIMLSASLRDEQQALDAGARFFIQKPYAGKDLVATIAATLEDTPA